MRTATKARPKGQFWIADWPHQECCDQAHWVTLRTLKREDSRFWQCGWPRRPGPNTHSVFDVRIAPSTLQSGALTVHNLNRENTALFLCLMCSMSETRRGLWKLAVEALQSLLVGRTFVFAFPADKVQKYDPSVSMSASSHSCVQLGSRASACLEFALRLLLPSALWCGR